MKSINIFLNKTITFLVLLSNENLLCFPVFILLFFFFLPIKELVIYLGISFMSMDCSDELGQILVDDMVLLVIDDDREFG